MNAQTNHCINRRNQAVAHSNTVLAQVLKLVSRHQFERLAEQHHVGGRFRKTSRWSQFVALATGQLSGRRSLRDIVSNLRAQASQLYHLGVRSVMRSTLARVNEQQPCEFYEALFGKLYGQCRSIAPRHGFRFKNKLYSLDASTIELSLAIFPWAKFRKRDGALKLHLGLDHDGGIPAFLSLTDGKVHEVTEGRKQRLPSNSIVVMDKGYLDYSWYKSLSKQGLFFVTRARRNTRYRVIERRLVEKTKGLRADQTIRLTGQKSLQEDLPTLRRVCYVDPESGQRYIFLTNNFVLAASTIAAIYKQRWQIELFFKWIKQNLKIKSFLGVSKNAVMTQVWVAMCVYLILAYLKFLSKASTSMQHILRLLQLNLFMRRDLAALLRNEPTEPIPVTPQQQLALA
jgi:putative transposase